MKTINERAKEFAKEEAKGYNPHLIAHAYNCGATDQQNIDIERACEWIRQTYMDDYAEDDCHNSVRFDKATFLEDFKKAMKGE